MSKFTPVLLPDGSKCYSGPDCKRHGNRKFLSSSQVSLLKEWGVNLPGSMLAPLETLLPSMRTVREGINGPEDERLTGLSRAREEFMRTGFSVEEENVMEWYTFLGYKIINPYLRGEEAMRKEALRYPEDFRGIPEDKKEEYVQEKIAEFNRMAPQRVEQLDAVFDRLPATREPRVLYRGYYVREAKNENQLRDFVTGAFKPGDVFVEDGYLSTSYDSDLMLSMAESRKKHYKMFVMEIVTKRNGLLLHKDEETGVQGSEREILLPRGMKFKVVNVGKAPYRSTYEYGYDPNFRVYNPTAPKKMTVVQLAEIE